MNEIKEPDFTYHWSQKPSGTDTWLTSGLSIFITLKLKLNIFNLVKEKARRIFEHELYMGNAEWHLIGYKYTVESLDSAVRDSFSCMKVSLGLKRNSSYYSLTLFVPIMVLTILTPVGLILPGKRCS